jgi:DNA-binding MarR family transcriptional regulator
MSNAQKYEALLDQVLELVVMLSEDAKASLAAQGLSASRARVLWRLREGARTQRELADALGVSPRTVTGLVDGLAETGFVTRQAHPTDRRATLVTLTPHGAATLAALVESRRAFARLLFEPLPRSQVDAFADGLPAILARLRRLVADAQQGVR